MAEIEEQAYSNSTATKERNLDIFMFVFDSLLLTVVIVVVKQFSASKVFDEIAVCELNANNSINGSLYFKYRKHGVDVFGNLTMQDSSLKYTARVHQFGFINEQCSKTGHELKDEEERVVQSYVKHTAHIGNDQFNRSTESVSLRIRKMSISSLAGRSLVFRRYIENNTSRVFACCSIVYSAGND